MIFEKSGGAVDWLIVGDHSLATTANTIAYIVSFIFNFIASTL